MPERRIRQHAPVVPCPGRQLLVVQQVTDLTSNIPIVEYDKAGKSFTVNYMPHNTRQTATRVALTRNS